MLKAIIVLLSVFVVVYANTMGCLSILFPKFLADGTLASVVVLLVFPICIMITDKLLGIPWRETP